MLGGAAGASEGNLRVGDWRDAGKTDRPAANIGCGLNIAHCTTTYVSEDVMTAGVEQGGGRWSKAQADTGRRCAVVIIDF